MWSQLGPHLSTLTMRLQGTKHVGAQSTRARDLLCRHRLGYWEKDGKAKDPDSSRRKHRKWRYARERLIRSGQLEQFKGTVDVPSRKR